MQVYFSLIIYNIFFYYYFLFAFVIVLLLYKLTQINFTFYDIVELSK